MNGVWTTQHCCLLESLRLGEASWLKADGAGEFWGGLDMLKVLRSHLGRQNPKLLFPKSGQNLHDMSNLCRGDIHEARGPFAAHLDRSRTFYQGSYKRC